MRSLNPKLCSLFIAALTIAPINYANADCVQLNEYFRHGECYLDTYWSKVTMAFTKPKLLDWVRVKMYDSMGQNIYDDEFSPSCNGHKGHECVFQGRGLNHPLLVSPQHRIEYVQFWYGDLGWHTNPNPTEGPKFVGEDVRDRRPWCWEGNWEPRTKEGWDDIDDFEYVSTIEEKRIECFFDCGLSNVKKEDIQPYTCGPPPPPPTPPLEMTVTVVSTALKLATKTKLKKETEKVTETKLEKETETVTKTKLEKETEIAIETKLAIRTTLVTETKIRTSIKTNTCIEVKTTTRSVPVPVPVPVPQSRNQTVVVLQPVPINGTYSFKPWKF
ncbi:hypothetical protein TWF718_002349 [Orbilia javanica]|uniref:Uncharacterized protein n=1 Tax=Orbilia javanica TaxID=47235 RepID=A0AAN8MNA3_9PEZI